MSKEARALRTKVKLFLKLFSKIGDTKQSFIHCAKLKIFRALSMMSALF